MTPGIFRKPHLISLQMEKNSRDTDGQCKDTGEL